MRTRIFVLLAFNLLVINTLFAQHVSEMKRREVPGTWCSMLAGPDYISTEKFSGFMHKGDSSSIIISILPSPYSSNIRAFNAETMARQNLKLERSEEIQLEKSKGMWYEFSQKLRGREVIKYMIVTGDSIRTVSISGFAPSANPTRCAEMRAMVRSVIYDPEAEQQLMEAVDYTLQLDASGFRPAQLIRGSMLFTVDGLSPTKAADKSTYIIASYVQNKPGDLLAFAVSKLNRLPLVDSLLHYSSDSIQIDGMKGFEVVGNALTKSGDSVLVFGVVLFNENKKSYIIQTGTTLGPPATFLPRFRELSRSYKRKEQSEN